MAVAASIAPRALVKIAPRRGPRIGAGLGMGTRVGGTAPRKGLSGESVAAIPARSHGVEVGGRSKLDGSRRWGCRCSGLRRCRRVLALAVLGERLTRQNQRLGTGFRAGDGVSVGDRPSAAADFAAVRTVEIARSTLRMLIAIPAGGVEALVAAGLLTLAATPGIARTVAARTLAGACEGCLGRLRRRSVDLGVRLVFGRRFELRVSRRGARRWGDGLASRAAPATSSPAATPAAAAIRAGSAFARVGAVSGRERARAGGLGGGAILRFVLSARLPRRRFSAARPVLIAVTVAASPASPAAVSAIGAASGACLILPFAAVQAWWAICRRGGVELLRIGSFFHEISNVEEGIALQADIHEARLHPRKNPGDAAVVNGAGERVFVLALVIDFGEGFVFDDCQPRLMRRAGDINFFRHGPALSARSGV